MHPGRCATLFPLVEHRANQLEAWLSNAIESFRSRNEGYLSRIPRIVLGVKMRDLEAKYNGDVLTCMKVLQMDRLAEETAGVERSTKKRKWLGAQDADLERSDESSRAVKNREWNYHHSSHLVLYSPFFQLEYLPRLPVEWFPRLVTYLPQSLSC